MLAEEEDNGPDLNDGDRYGIDSSRPAIRIRDKLAFLRSSHLSSNPGFLKPAKREDATASSFVPPRTGEGGRERSERTGGVLSNLRHRGGVTGPHPPRAFGARSPLPEPARDGAGIAASLALSEVGSGSPDAQRCSRTMRVTPTARLRPTWPWMLSGCRAMELSLPPTSALAPRPTITVSSAETPTYSPASEPGT